MLKSYFFIPADKFKFIENIRNINADYFVFDFEDAVHPNNLEIAFANIGKIDILDRRFFVRPNLYCSAKTLELSQLEKLINIGFINFILPKLEEIDEIEKVLNTIDKKCLIDSTIVFLFETPKSIINAKEILSKFPQINAVGFGSHDYAALMQMSRPENYIISLQHYINMLGKAFSLITIDTASMEIHDLDRFRGEVKRAFEMGYDGKFIIHPKQLQLQNEYPYYNFEEIEEAESVLNAIENDENRAIIKMNGRMIEKPHLQRYRKIIEWKKRNAAK